MKVLLIIAAVILFFVLLLSIRLSATVHFDEDVSLDVQWLFIKLHILPKDETKKKKKKKKDKKKKDKKKDEKTDEKPDETVKEPKDKKGDSIVVRFYKNKGISGFIELLENLVRDLKGMFGGIIRAFIINDIFISLIVAGEDSAQTAEKFGKTCATVYPLLGYIYGHMKVKKRRTEIIPDFIYNKNVVRIHAKISVIPRALINAIIAVAFRLLFNVLLKFLRGSKAKKKADTEAE